MTRWRVHLEEPPTESGYYYTCYFNKDEDKHFYKSIYWHAQSKKWLPWRPGTVAEPEVIAYVAETRHDYYAPSLIAATEMVKEHFILEEYYGEQE